MGFKEKDKLKALAIVHIFETSKAFGDYAACVVLNDGAGVSYGINQFTHRSGSLLAVVKTYLEKGGAVGRAAIENALPVLKEKSAGAIGELSGNGRFKKALKAAAVTREMREAQHEIAESKYLNPALEAAEGSGFTLPLSLAVIYDSINHGSYARIRDRVKITRENYSSQIEFEKAWVYSYVKNRDAWLESVPRLAVTDYRTDFFFAQIARGNWNLDLPVNVHGLQLTDDLFAGVDGPKRGEGAEEEKESAAGPAVESVPNTSETLHPSADTPAIDTAPPIPAEGGATGAGTVSDTIPQLIPKIDGAKRWLGGGAAASFFGMISTKLAGMPDWMVFMLGFFCGVFVTGLVLVFWRHIGKVFDLVKHVADKNENPLTNNIQLFGDVERYRAAVDARAGTAAQA
jgi:chitosanase